MSAEDALGVELARAQEDGQVFAVVDAAHFEYLQDTLTTERFTFDPLYLDEVDNPTIASGPHLVHVTGPSQIVRLREIIGDEPACVWWVWPDEPGAGEAIYRHLRGLNMVEIPRDRFDADEEDRGPGYESVLFRHGDTNVMASMIPVLRPDQLGRLFGNAKAIILDAPDYGGVQRHAKSSSALSPQHGMLRISEEQYEKLVEIRIETMAPSVEMYLRRATPDRADEHDTEAFEEIVARSLRAGKGYRLRSVKAYCRWALLYFASDGRINGTTKFMSIMLDTRDGSTPDQRMERVFDAFRARL